MAQETFKGSFTQQPALSEAAIQSAVDVMRSGRLHRYNVAPGETPPVSLLERELADYLGVEYCLALASGGYAIQTALRAVGVGRDDAVLTNGFTLSPVPGAISAVGAKPVLVDCTSDLVIDLDDLAQKATSTRARFLVLSHMRGHIVDMDALMRVADGLNLLVIEDCAHTLGASWNGVPSGNHGTVACYSTQTYKHLNSGEGGFLTTNDSQVMAKATLLSGSYMLYDRHGTAPDPAVFDAIKLETPNCSGRMDNLRAAILRPQLAELTASIEEWNARYARVAEQLQGVNRIELPHRPAEEHFVGSSLQFRVASFSQADCEALLAACEARGVELKWFGRDEPVAFTSRYDSWRYVASQSLPQTDDALAQLFDMRIPLTFTLEDCSLVGRIIAGCVGDVSRG